MGRSCVAQNIFPGFKIPFGSSIRRSGHLFQGRCAVEGVGGQFLLFRHYVLWPDESLEFGDSGLCERHKPTSGQVFCLVKNSIASCLAFSFMNPPFA